MPRKKATVKIVEEENKVEVEEENRVEEKKVEQNDQTNKDFVLLDQIGIHMLDNYMIQSKNQLLKIKLN